MTGAEQLAAFVARASYDDLSEGAREQLKGRVLDALACAIGALEGEPIRAIRAQVKEFGRSGPCTLIGGGRTAPDRAAFYNGALVRYLAFNALRITRTGALSHWKGLAYPNTAFGCTHATFLAMYGITGPLGVFEGTKGFMDAIAGRFEIDWSHEGLERVTRTGIKKYNAEYHSQPAIEGILELKQQHGFAAADVERIDIEIFDVAYHIIGGGEEGDKTAVRTKEEADHSLPYLVAVALLDDRVMPEQYRPDRIRRDDVQSLLRKVSVRPSADYSRRFPDEMPCRLSVALRDGRVVVNEKRDFEGFPTRPVAWQAVVRKFEQLSESTTAADLRNKIVDAVARLDTLPVSHLTSLLAQVRMARPRARRRSQG